MATRARDLRGGIDYGFWMPSLVSSTTPNTAALANTNVLSTTTYAGVIYPGLPIFETGILRVIVAENTGVIFNLVLTRNFGQATQTTSVMSYNAGGPLAANSLYLFDVPVQAGDVINFQFGGATTVLELDAYMIIAMGP